jgi:hypothetical protein
MKLLGVGTRLFDVDTWLQAYDPEFADGIGKAVETTDPAKARTFPSFEAVMETWKTRSKTRPTRDDGRPNRPLTAYTIQPEKIPD